MNVYIKQKQVHRHNTLLITKGEKEVRRDKLGGAQWLSCKESAAIQETRRGRFKLWVG